MDCKAKQRSSQPSKKKETKIRQNNRGMNKLRRRGLGFQKPKLLHNKGNYKQGEKTALRMGENNSK